MRLVLDGNGLTRRPATLVDLLDRLLDRGLVVDADVVITLAGIPLIGLNLRAALAGMETMARYGVMADWDRRIRAEAGTTQGAAGPALDRVPGQESPVRPIDIDRGATHRRGAG